MHGSSFFFTPSVSAAALNIGNGLGLLFTPLVSSTATFSSLVILLTLLKTVVAYIRCAVGTVRADTVGWEDILVSLGHNN